MQEVFLQIWRVPERFLRAKGDLCAWLAVVSRNRSIDQLRKRHSRDEVAEIEGTSFASPFNLATHSEHAILCERAVLIAARLPSEQRRALELAFFEGMTHAEISDMTGCPLGTIKTRIRSALSILRKGMETAATIG